MWLWFSKMNFMPQNDSGLQYKKNIFFFFFSFMIALQILWRPNSHQVRTCKYHQSSALGVEITQNNEATWEIVLRNVSQYIKTESIDHPALYIPHISVGIAHQSG